MNVNLESRRSCLYAGFWVGGVCTGGGSCGEAVAGTVVVVVAAAWVRGRKGVVERKVSAVGNEDEVDGRVVGGFGGGGGSGFEEAGFKGERGYAPVAEEVPGGQNSSSRPRLWGCLDSGVLCTLCGRGAGGKLRFQNA